MNDHQPHPRASHSGELLPGVTLVSGHHEHAIVSRAEYHVPFAPPPILRLLRAICEEIDRDGQTDRALVALVQWRRGRNRRKPCSVTIVPSTDSQLYRARHESTYTSWRDFHYAMGWIGTDDAITTEATSLSLRPLVGGMGGHQWSRGAGEHSLRAMLEGTRIRISADSPSVIHTVSVEGYGDPLSVALEQAAALHAEPMGSHRDLDMQTVELSERLAAIQSDIMRDAVTIGCSTMVRSVSLPLLPHQLKLTTATPQ